MKKPEKTLPLCPLIQSECVEDGCKFYLKMSRRDIVTGKIEEYQECAFVVQVAVVGENSMMMVQMNATLQALRNETQGVEQALSQAGSTVKRIGGKP